MTETATLIRWGMGLGMVIFISLAIMSASNGEYTLNVNTDENTQKAIASMSKAVENQGQRVIDLEVALALCKNQTRS